MNLKIFSIALALTSSLPTLAFAMDDNTEEANAIVSAPTFRMDQTMSAINTLIEKAKEHSHNISDDEVYNKKSIQWAIQALAEKYAAEMLKDEAMKSAVKAVKTVKKDCLLKFNDDQFKEVGLRAVEKVDHEGTRISFDNIKLQLQKDEILKGEKYSYALWKIIQSFKAIQLSLSYYTTQGHEKIGAFLKDKDVKTLDACFQQDPSEAQIWDEKGILQKITTHIETLETSQGVSLGKNPTMERAVSAIEKLFHSFKKAEDKSKEETAYLKNIWQLEVRFKRAIECLEGYFKYDEFTNFLGEERFSKSLDEYFREKYPSEAADQIIKFALTLEKSILEENPHQTQAITSIVATSSTEETTIPSVVTASSSQTKENITDPLKAEDQKARLQKASDPASDVDIAILGLRLAFYMFLDTVAEFCDN